MILSDTLLQQTRIHFPRFEEARSGFRRSRRAARTGSFTASGCRAEQSIVLVKYSREQAENRRYVEIAQFLAEHGVRAPKIYFHDPAEGLIWIEDLGERDLWSYRDGELAGAARVLRIGADAKSPSCIAFRRRTRPKSGAICRRNSTPRFIAGSRVTFSRIVSAVISVSTRSGWRSWPVFPPWRKSRSGWRVSRAS